MPTAPSNQPGRLHIQRALDNVSLAWIQSQSDFVADRVFPNIPTDHQSDIYHVWPKGTTFRTEVQPRSPGARTPRVTWRTEEATFLCPVYDLGHDIYDEERDNADSEWELDQIGAQLLTSQHMLYREKKWADAYFKTGVWTFERAGQAAGPLVGNAFLQFSNPASDPLTLIQTDVIRMHESTGVRPNFLMITPYVEVVLTNHPLIIERVKYTGVAKAFGITTPNAGTAVFRDILAEMFGVPRVMVASAVINTAPAEDDSAPAYDTTGLIPGMHYLFGRHMLLGHAAPSAGKRVPSAGYTFSWRRKSAATDMGMRTIKVRDIEGRKDSIIMEQAFAQKVTAADLAYFYSSAVA